MRQGFAVILWIWLAISLGVYGYRIWRRITQGPKSAREGLTDEQAVGGEGRPLRDLLASDARIRTAEHEPPMPDQDGPRNNPPTHDIAPLAEGDEPMDVTTQSAPAPEVPRSETPTPKTTGQHPRRVEVASALGGITMPCDLTPVINDRVHLEPFKAVFSTTNATPGELKEGLAGELDSLGFEIHEVSDHELVAERGAINVSVRLFGPKGENAGDDLTRFGTLPDNSMVVVFAT